MYANQTVQQHGCQWVANGLTRISVRHTLRCNYYWVGRPPESYQWTDDNKFSFTQQHIHTIKTTPLCRVLYPSIITATASTKNKRQNHNALGYEVLRVMFSINRIKTASAEFAKDMAFLSFRALQLCQPQHIPPASRKRCGKLGSSCLALRVPFSGLRACLGLGKLTVF